MDTDQLWTLLGLPQQSVVFSFCHRSSVSVRGRAGSPLWLFLYPFCHRSNASVGEELVHHCHHVSVQMKKMFCCCVLLVQPLLSSAGYKCVVQGNVQVWGCLVSADVQVQSCGLATMCSGSLDLDARGLDLGSYTLYERPDQNEISVLNQMFLLFFRFFSVVFMCFSCTFHEKCSFSYKKFHFSWKLTKPAQCVYTCIIYTYMHHQIPPKYKIYLVGLPFVLYERPSQNERSVLNQLFLLLFRCFSVFFMYFSWKQTKPGLYVCIHAPFTHTCTTKYHQFMCIFTISGVELPEVEVRVQTWSKQTITLLV